MPRQYAQTNLQLYNQMLARGYDLRDIASMKAGYDLSLQLFSGQYRASGKPFLAHLVGTASILVAREVPTTMAVAGLLHASYTHGRFPSPLSNLRLVKYRKLRKSLGSEVDALVSAYTRFRLSHVLPEGTRHRPGDTGSVQRDVLTIRLANDLEDQLDNGPAYCAKHPGLYAREDVLDQLQLLATTAWHRELLAEIRELRRAHTGATISSDLSTGRSGSFHVPRRRGQELRRWLKSLTASNE